MRFKFSQIVNLNQLNVLDIEVTIELDGRNAISKRAFIVDQTNQLTARHVIIVKLTKNTMNKMPLNLYFFANVSNAKLTWFLKLAVSLKISRRVLFRGCGALFNIFSMGAKCHRI